MYNQAKFAGLRLLSDYPKMTDIKAWGMGMGVRAQLPTQLVFCSQVFINNLWLCIGRGEVAFGWPQVYQSVMNTVLLELYLPEVGETPLQPANCTQLKKANMAKASCNQLLLIDSATLCSSLDQFTS